MKVKLKNNLLNILVPITFIYNELLLAYKCEFDFSSYRFAGVVFTSLSLSLAALFLCSLSNKPKVNKWLHFVITEIITIIYTIEFFLDETYSAFMSIESITAGAGGVLTSYKDILLNIFTKGFGNILLFQIPALIILLLCIIIKNELVSKKYMLFFYILSFVFLLSLGNNSLINTQIAKAKYTYEYMFDDSVRTFGLSNSLYLDVKYMNEGVPEVPWVYIPTEKVEITRYGKNEQSINWDKLSSSTSNKTIQSLANLIENATPTNKNDYTGLFEGKNLIQITIESFTKELVREDLFPLVYKMATEGIVVEDYYHPFWGGSTTSGEAAIMTGLIPVNCANTMQTVIGKDNGYTLAPYFKDKGYSTVAYHDGTHIYYNRIKTHPALGFSKFYANGSGMEKYLQPAGIGWPQSDVDMFNFIVDDLEKYEGNFYAYIMTISGHGPYNYSTNRISGKNRNALVGDPFYNKGPLGAYVAASLDFEYGLEHLVEYLDERGILEDTVFVLTCDHYPYPLQNGSAWLNDRNYLEDLYGYYPSNQPKQDHNALIIWSPCLEEQEQIVVSEPCYAPDILPTLLNLFGMDYDSRLYSGRDILSDSSGLVIWNNSSWLTNKGYYNSTSGKFTPNEGVEVNDSYIEKCKQVVRDKMSVARNFISADFYKYFSDCIIMDDK